MFKIGDFSRLTSVSIRMLRYYSEVGIFEPESIDEFSGYRYYSATQISKLNRIIALRNMGFKVSEIAGILNESSEKEVKIILLNKQSEVALDIVKEEEKLKLITSAIEDFTKEKINMKYNVELKKVPSYQVLSLREVIPTYEDEGMLWGKISKFIENKGISCNSLSYATYYDEGYKDEDVDVEIVISVKEKLEDEGDFCYKDTESIDLAASVLVPGDFSNIAPAFQFLGKWIEENGYSIAGNARQLPLKGPWNEDKAENYLNEILMPITKVK